jgi:hypothetical protein
MTLAEFLALLASGKIPENYEEVLRALIKAELEAEIERLTEGKGIAGLKDAKETLLREKKKAESDRDAALAKLEDLKKRTAGLLGEGGEGTGFENERQTLLTQHETEVAGLNTKIKRLNAVIEYMAIERAASEALLAEGAAPDGLPGAVARFRAQSTIQVQGLESEDVKPEDVKAVVITNLGAKPLRDHAKTFMGTPEGKFYRAARGNAGGGAEGDGGGDAAEVNPWLVDSWNVTKQGQLRKNEPEKANRLFAAAGSPVTKPVKKA